MGEQQAINAIGTLQEIDDHFNCGGVYDETVRQQMVAIFAFLWSLTSTPPIHPPVWVSRDEQPADELTKG